MAKMFDKVSQDFLSAIKGVLEAKKVNKHGHDHPGEEDEDIDNDGDTDTSDKYLHNRRKAIGKAMKKEEVEQIDETAKVVAHLQKRYGDNIRKSHVRSAANDFGVGYVALAHAVRKKLGVNRLDEEQIDEISADMKSRYKKGAQRSLDQAQDFKSELDHEGEPKGSRVRKDVSRIIKNRKMGMKRANEEAETLDELSTKTLEKYRNVARADAYDADDVDDNKRFDKRAKGITKANKAIRKNFVKSANEETQIDELSKATLATYAVKAKNQMGRDEYRAGVRMGGRDGRGKEDEMEKAHQKRAEKRSKGIDTALDKLAKEETQIDEISTKTAVNYMDKASDARGHRNLSTPKLDKRYKSMALAHEKIRSRHAKVATTEETALTAEEIAMIEAKMAGVAPGSMDCDKHMCATKVFHKEWAEGTPIKTMHADPDAEGLIEWYDVMFEHGIERVMTEDMEILQAESHMHSKRKMKEEVEELDELSKDTMLKYLSANKKSGARGGRDTIKRMRGADMAVRKYTARDSKYVRVPATEEVEIEEARGRPKKAGQMDYTVHPVTKEKMMHNNPEHMKRIEKLQKTGMLEKPKREASQHIMNQLSKAKTSMRGGETIHFTHGEAKHVSGSHAAKLITKYQGMKPSEKEDFQKKIGHSHEQLMKHV